MDVASRGGGRRCRAVVLFDCWCGDGRIGVALCAVEAGSPSDLGRVCWSYRLKKLPRAGTYHLLVRAVPSGNNAQMQFGPTLHNYFKLTF